MAANGGAFSMPLAFFLRHALCSQVFLLPVATRSGEGLHHALRAVDVAISVIEHSPLYLQYRANMVLGRHSPFLTRTQEGNHIAACAMVRKIPMGRFQHMRGFVFGTRLVYYQKLAMNWARHGRIW